MLRFAADECLNLNIVAELRRRNPEIDIVTVQERNLRGQPDSVILEWAASEGRILVTRDANSLCGLAYQRIRNGEPTPGVFIVPWAYPIGEAARELELVAGASLDGEWENRVEFLPLP